MLSQITLGVSTAVRTLLNAEEVSALVDRALSGDPGDGCRDDDLNEVMEIVSADMDERFSHRSFNPGIHCLLRPCDQHMMLFTDADAKDPDFMPGIEMFGFDPVTLQPL